MVSSVVYLAQLVRPVNLGVFYPHPLGTLPVGDVVFAAGGAGGDERRGNIWQEKAAVVDRGVAVVPGDARCR